MFDLYYFVYFSSAFLSFKLEGKKVLFLTKVFHISIKNEIVNELDIFLKLMY